MLQSRLKTFFCFVFAISVLFIFLMMRPASYAAPGDMVRVSIATNGTEGNEESIAPAVSQNGRFIAFHSAASNLVNGDTNNRLDVFVRDTHTNTTSRVSVASDGTQGNHDSGTPSISADGRFVAFMSRASNLVGNDTNGHLDVFVHDRQTSETVRVSRGPGGVDSNDISQNPAISANGRYVVFDSLASNLIVGDTNNKVDVFLYDLQTNVTRRISLASNGAEANGYATTPAISADGRFVTFMSNATNLVNNDTNLHNDIFLRDVQLKTTIRVSVATNGAEANDDAANPAISADGRFIAFDSQATNLVLRDGNEEIRDVFVRDTQNNTTRIVSLSVSNDYGSGHSSMPALSADGRYVSFSSYSPNLVPGDSNGAEDVFVRDILLGMTTAVSAAGDVFGNGGSNISAISANGRFIAFTSEATNFTTGDSNGFPDIYLFENILPIKVFLPVVIKN